MADKAVKETSKHREPIRQQWQSLTLASGTIHNPDEPRHFMKLKPIHKTVRISRNGESLAVSNNAIRLIEVGGDLYDPPIYIPRSDIIANLLPSDRRTNCPLKGEAEYFNLLTGDDIAWSYSNPFPFASDLTGLVAFYPDRVTIEETQR